MELCDYKEDRGAVVHCESFVSVAVCIAPACIRYNCLAVLRQYAADQNGILNIDIATAVCITGEQIALLPGAFKAY